MGDQPPRRPGEGVVWMVRARKRPPLQPGQAPDNRGGQRQGQPGKVYSNRRDLAENRATAQPVRTVPNQEYGKATQQAQAQRVVPLHQAPPTPTPSATFGGAFASVPVPQSYVAPGEVEALNAPTSRPGEPPTAGLTAGPGPGPEVLGPRPAADPDLEGLRPYLPTLELLASQPNASPSARMFVRRLRGSMPPSQAG